MFLKKSDSGVVDPERAPAGTSLHRQDGGVVGDKSLTPQEQSATPVRHHRTLDQHKVCNKEGTENTDFFYFQSNLINL